MNQNIFFAIESLHTRSKHLELISVKRLHDGTPIAPGLPETETDPTNNPPQQERTPIPENYTLPDRHREAKERERKLVEYSDHRQHITLSEIYRAAVSFLRDKGHHIILEDTKYLEERENDVDSEGFNDTPRLKIKMIEASNGQLFYFIDELKRKVMDLGGTIRIASYPGAISTEGERQQYVRTFDDVENFMTRNIKTFLPEVQAVHIHNFNRYVHNNPNISKSRLSTRFCEYFEKNSIECDGTSKHIPELRLGESRHEYIQMHTKNGQTFRLLEDFNLKHGLSHSDFHTEFVSFYLPQIAL
jgi:hypothetical protein